MKSNGLFIDLRNAEHVKWWNETASKLVKVVSYNYIVETATNKKVGVMFYIKGLRKNKVIKENVERFIKNPVTMKMKIKV